MRKAHAILGLVVLLTLAVLAFAQDANTVDWQAVDKAMGITGEMQPGKVRKYSLPRSDLRVMVQGITIQPALSLGTWVSFEPTGNRGRVLVMGDLVLTEQEYNQVISMLQDSGIGQTAIHKHLPDMQPPVWWVHIQAQGDPAKIAGAIHAALAATGTPFQDSNGSTASTNLGLDTAQLDQILGQQGEAKGGVYTYSIPHAGTFTADGMDIPAAMGTAIGIGFQPLENGRVAINGDFAMLAKEINPVLRTLREHGILVVSLHNHMTSADPPLYFTHFWQVGNPTELAKGLRAALDQIDTARGK